MKCPKCGAELAEGVRFCRECGSRIELNERRPHFCSTCGGALVEGARFCPYCGAKVNAAPEMDSGMPSAGAGFSAQTETAGKHEAAAEAPPKPQAASGALTEQEGAAHETAAGDAAKRETAGAAFAPAASAGDSIPREEAGAQTKLAAAAKGSFTDALKAKARALWARLDRFGKVSAVCAAAAVLLLLVAVCSGTGLAIFFSVLQLVLLALAVLLHKGVSEFGKGWLKYLVLVMAILLTVLNIMCYFWKAESAPRRTIAQPQPQSHAAAASVSPALSRIAAPFSAADCVGKDHADVRENFAAAGFTNIAEHAVPDLAGTDADKVGTVASIAVGKNASFVQGAAFDRDEKTVISYHTLKKCAVTIHVNFIPNLIFSTYNVKFSLNGTDEGTMEHGIDQDFSLDVEPGEYTLTFAEETAPAVKGETTLSVNSDVHAEYRILCYSDEITVETLCVDRDVELAAGETKLDVPASQYQHETLEEVTAALKALGFTNIRAEALYDIVLGWTEKGEVESVSIAGKQDFVRGDVFAKTAEVIIQYHMPAEDEPSNLISMPAGSDSYLGMSYPQVEQAFRDMGFATILCDGDSEEDPAHANGAVYTVKVADAAFAKGDSRHLTDTVIIEYYGFDLTPLYYSTNDFETARAGSSGVFGYKSRGGTYDLYCIVDFDAGFVYWFSDGNNDSICDRLKIGSGDLNDVLVVTYHDGGDVWSEGLHFKWKRQPEHLIMEDHNHFEYDYYATDLQNALTIRSSKEIQDY